MTSLNAIFSCLLFFSCVFSAFAIQADQTKTSSSLPPGFVYLSDIDPSIIQTMKYNTEDNFVGRPIQGYHASKCILTREAAIALARIQNLLRPKALSLEVFDCYRPTMAVADFIAWSKDIKDQKQKRAYYPRINKADFFKLGYVAAKSGHSRGSTVDLTLVRLNSSTGAPPELNMGTHFDFMDLTSHFSNHHVSKEAQDNRLYLQTLLKQQGFRALEEEWWHFTLISESFSTTYFNFPVE